MFRVKCQYRGLSMLDKKMYYLILKGCTLFSVYKHQISKWFSYQYSSYLDNMIDNLDHNDKSIRELFY